MVRSSCVDKIKSLYQSHLHEQVKEREGNMRDKHVYELKNFIHHVELSDDSAIKNITQYILTSFNNLLHTGIFVTQVSYI